MGFDRLVMRGLCGLDPRYGLLLAFGVALVLEGVFQNAFGISGRSYSVPELLQWGTNLGFMFLPKYRIWVVRVAFAVCFASWFMIEMPRLGACLRAGTRKRIML